MRPRWLVAVISVVFLLAGVCSSPASAENVQVTAGVGDTTVLLSGWTAPFAFVTVMENSVVVGTTTAQADGRYMLLLVGQTPGIHNFRVFSRDSKGRITDAVTTQLNISEHTQTIVSIFLPPVVVTTEQGDAVIVEGSTVPGATVIITIGGKYFKTQADSAGNWRYVIAASDLPASEYRISVTAILPGGLQSYAAAIPSVAIPPLASRHAVSTPDLHPGLPWPRFPTLPQTDELLDNVGKEPIPGYLGKIKESPENIKKTARYADNIALSLLFFIALLITTQGWALLASRRNGKNRIG